jgi:hypothetical protein
MAFASGIFDDRDEGRQRQDNEWGVLDEKMFEMELLYLRVYVSLIHYGIRYV